jgi:hypothetical protein
MQVPRCCHTSFKAEGYSEKLRNQAPRKPVSLHLVSLLVCGQSIWLFLTFRMINEERAQAPLFLSVVIGKIKHFPTTHEVMQKET